MEDIAGIVAVIGFCLMFLPVAHAARSGDKLAIASAAALCLAAAATLATAKSVIHEILSALIWIAAYLGAVFADYSRNARRPP